MATIPDETNNDEIDAMNASIVEKEQVRANRLSNDLNIGILRKSSKKAI